MKFDNFENFIEFLSSIIINFIFLVNYRQFLSKIVVGFLKNLKNLSISTTSTKFVKKRHVRARSNDVISRQSTSAFDARRRSTSIESHFHTTFP